MAIVWDVGTAIAGSGTVERRGALLKVVLDTIPTYLTSSGAAPALYRNLGLVGPVVNTARQLGEVLQWPTQLVGPFPTIADSIWYRLVAGVSGTLYQGVEMSSDIAIGCRVNTLTGQSISTSTNTPLTFDLEEFDPWGMHSASVNPTRVTVPEPGWYIAEGNISWPSNATGTRKLRIKKNDALFISTVIAPAVAVAGVPQLEVVSVMYLSAGDYLELIAWQDSGGSLTPLAGGGESPHFSVCRLG